ncbi:MAG: hypothetical protein NZ959_02495 [Armatimonadetes bacterium]|nr:hypothetical protein [Armatimonadota bacterium]MDW8120958.1 hypothetical protein [Armatimonadota bacterium]
MRLMINGADVTQWWAPEEEGRQVILPLAPWAAALGLQVYKSGTLQSVMICSKDQCTPLSLLSDKEEGLEKSGQFYATVSAMAKVLGGLFRVTDKKVVLEIPEVPLPGTLSLGDRVPDVTWYGSGGATFVPAELCRGRIVVAKVTTPLEIKQRFLWCLIPTIEFDNLPEQSLADPFDTFSDLFGHHSIVGLDPQARWQQVFSDLQSAQQWAEADGEKGRPEWYPSLRALTIGWVQALRDPENAYGWLALAELQRTYCGLEAAVPNYQQAAKAKGPKAQYGQWRWGLALWLLGRQEEAWKVWDKKDNVAKSPELWELLMSKRR